jgi:hypothetical protein
MMHSVTMRSALLESSGVSACPRLHVHFVASDRGARQVDAQGVDMRSQSNKLCTYQGGKLHPIACPDTGMYRSPEVS